jgi:UDP-GlcNAc:undecaprenyl-phosphate GlcNAc-1-phosphate transferase
MFLMTLPAVLLVVFAVALATSLILGKRLTYVSVKARRPERSRHWSASGIPRIGGIAVFGAAPVAILLAAVAAATLNGSIPQLPELSGSLILAGAILFVIGLMDDLRGVRPAVKLIAQTAATLIVYRAGFSIDQLTLLPGHVIHLGYFALPVTVLWLVGVSNAFNLIDGLDGLAGGVAIIALLAIATAGLILGNGSVPIYTVALVGALLGFLKYNWPSARLFMGDSGSLVIGFLLAVLSVKGATDADGVTAGIIPIFALAYPLFDTGIAIMRRWLRGVPLSRADMRHVHHQLGSVGLGPKKSLMVIYAGSASIALLGLLVAFAPPQVTLVATMVGVAILILVVALGIHWLQYHEFLEAGASLKSAAQKARSVIQDKINARDVADSILQAGSIEEIHVILHDSASTFRFAYMRLSTPASRSEMPGRITQELQALKLWKLEYPIVHGGSQEYDGLCLTIWCALGAAHRPAGAERVAQIVAPAIATWVRGAQIKLSATSSERFMHARENDGQSELTPQDQQILAGMRWEPKNENTLEA